MKKILLKHFEASWLYSMDHVLDTLDSLSIDKKSVYEGEDSSDISVGYLIWIFQGA